MRSASSSGPRRPRRGVDPYVVMEEAAAAIPAGSNGIVGDLLERHGRQALGPGLARRSSASTSTTRRLGSDGLHPGARGAGRLCRRAATSRSSSRSRARSIDELVFTGGAAKGRLWPQIVADVLGLPVSVPAVVESTRARGGALRRPRGRPLSRPRRGRRARSCNSTGPSSPSPPTATSMTRGTSAGQRSTAASSSCPRRGSCGRCGGRPEPDRSTSEMNAERVANHDDAVWPNLEPPGAAPPGRPAGSGRRRPVGDPG